MSTETVRQVLRATAISWQATKTWKASRDPEFATKLARLLALYDAAAGGARYRPGGRVICVDERTANPRLAEVHNPAATGLLGSSGIGVQLRASLSGELGRVAAVRRAPGS
ncbi:MAG: hypothetical protein QOE59_827 [Actinomycetota bacterium]|nr:hypothetical protein [Actinomycetota bacterium]